MNSNYGRTINVGSRITTMILDHCIMTMVIMIFYFPTMYNFFTKAISVSHGSEGFSPLDGPWKYFALFGFSLYFCKDCINGRSIGKRILKFQIIDYKSGNVASPMQCLVRNLFCLIWPIEVIVAMTNTSRRLGDRVAGTKLIYFDPDLVQPGFNLGKVILPFIVAYGLTILATTYMPSFLPQRKAIYSETSYNHQESKDLEKVISDSLAQYLTPDIRVYDSTQLTGLKFVSAVLNLKENYIADDDSYRVLHEVTTNLIYSKFPKETFKGEIKYYYKGDSYFRSRSTTMGAETR